MICRVVNHPIFSENNQHLSATGLTFVNLDLFCHRKIRFSVLQQVGKSLKGGRLTLITFSICNTSCNINALLFLGCISITIARNVSGVPRHLGLNLKCIIKKGNQSHAKRRLVRVNSQKCRYPFVFMVEQTSPIC
jgi:hypothetical protein